MASTARTVTHPHDARNTAAAPAPTPSARSEWMANLRRRVLTAAALIPVVLAVVWLGGWATFAAAVVVLAVGMWELRAMFARRGWRPLVVLSGALGLDFLLAAMLPQQRAIMLEAGTSACMIVSFVWLMLTRPATERTLVDWALSLATPFYLGWSLAFLVLLRGSQIGFASRGFWWLLLLLLAVWVNDSAALLAGHALGRHKLAPRLSPGKTWEGVVGGLLGAAIVVVVVVVVADLVLPRALRLDLAWYELVVFGGLISLAATLGDLAKSLVKRATGVKDSGSIFPGHGGMLDRIDSLLFAGYVVYFGALILGLLR